MGYEKRTLKIHISPGTRMRLDVKLKPRAINLNPAVVSAGLYVQKLSRVSVSMEVIQPGYIESRNTRNLATVINQTPGIDVLDGQASIRGGGGYSYGAGSRVLMLLDGLPLLSADAGDVKWNFIPLETIAQVEIIKGASSALYGSSALDGIINVRTRWPGIKPKTSVILYTGLYDKPKRRELAWWWKANPWFGGIRFSHARKIKNFDLVLGADAYGDAGYREKNYERHIRFDAKIRYRPKKLEGLSFALQSIVQAQSTSDFFLWQNADSGAFLQQPAGIAPAEGFRLLVDPRVQYFDKHHNKHNLSGRFYETKNTFRDNPDKNSTSHLFYGEYRFYRNFNDKIHLTAGFTALYGNTRSALYGNHFNANYAVFTQADGNVTRGLTLSAGLRAEYYSIDRANEKTSFVTRFGLNYKVAKYTFLRASFGQGYRYPSIAEKFTATRVGAINIFPNPELQPEKGWNTETGLRQGFRLGGVSGFVDAALFWSEYHNLIEFTFGVYKPDSVQIPTLKDVGFKSLNVGRARITGLDVSVSGAGKIGAMPFRFFVGYTYMNPVDLNADTLKDNILKYRYRHEAKGDVQLSYRKCTLGLSMVYRSFMERIDDAFEEKILGQEILPGLKTYREKNDRGAVVFDLRFSYRLGRATKLSLIVDNLFNKEYMGRPGDIRPPRSFTLQFSMQL
ncbi:MAG TPA: TonB-dependent receptor [Bacteroidetes bacterium]|nr:TonB-dependent receptor [Bacteroidota bacterium]